MNDKAVQLGLSHTHFANPHGLDAEDIIPQPMIWPGLLLMRCIIQLLPVS